MDIHDDTLVYVDPDNRTVIGPVEWEGDEPKKRPREQTEDPSKKMKMKRMYYPYCTVRTAKHFLWKKRPSPENRKLSLDDAIQKAVIEPFWD